MQWQSEPIYGYFWWKRRCDDYCWKMEISRLKGRFINAAIWWNIDHETNAWKKYLSSFLANTKFILMCGEITFRPQINYTFRQWFQTIKRRSALKNQRFVTKKKMRRKWSPHISRERSRGLGTNLLSLFFLCSFSAGKTSRHGFFV